MIYQRGILHVIGYGAGDKLGLISMWDEDMHGYPLEFYDAPNQYISNDHDQDLRIFDPARMALFNDKIHRNNRLYRYDHVMEQIENE